MHRTTDAARETLVSAESWPYNGYLCNKKQMLSGVLGEVQKGENEVMNRVYKFRVFGKNFIVGWFGRARWNKRLQIM